MTDNIEYGPAFYGSDEISELIGIHPGQWQYKTRNGWNSGEAVTFGDPFQLYRLRLNHSFYDSDEFKRAKKPDDVNPLADYSDDELQDEIERRKNQSDEIKILARKICDTESQGIPKQFNFSCGEWDNHNNMLLVKAAIIAGIELQKGREA